MSGEVSPLRPHDLRHTFAFQLARSTGADAYELERAGGSSFRAVHPALHQPAGGGGRRLCRAILMDRRGLVGGGEKVGGGARWSGKNTEPTTTGSGLSIPDLQDVVVLDPDSSGTLTNQPAGTGPRSGIIELMFWVAL